MSTPDQMVTDRSIFLEEIDMLRSTYVGADLVYQAALMYVRRGFYIIPIVEGGKAIPPIRYNMGYGQAARNVGTVESWFGPKGKFRGWNIGIACGKADGVFAVDIDMHESDGIQSWRKLCADNKYTAEAPTAWTPSGGKHLLFRWEANCRSSTGKIAKSIDTRGGEKAACKSHIVVWPSVVDGKEYVWIVGGRAPAVPKFIVDAMGNWVQPILPPGRGNEEVGMEDVVQEIPLVKVAEMLMQIDPNKLSYDDWLRVGMAIHSQHPSPEGLAVWDEWSKDGNRYKANECSTRWVGFDSRKGTTIGSLIYFAKNHGWIASKEDEQIDPMGAMVARFNETFAVMVVGSDYRILQEQPDWKEYHANGMIVPKYKYLKKETFLTITASDVMFVKTPKGPKPMKSALLWLGHPGRRQYMGSAMVPGGEAPEGFFNQWSGWAVDPIPGDCSIWLNHCLEVLCRGNKEQYEWLIDWFADAVQHTNKPKGTAVIVVGVEGTGKGMLLQSFGRMFGPHYVHVTSAERLTGRFNAGQASALFVFADEVMWGGNRSAAGVLKGLVTEKYIEVEKKGIDAEMSINLVRLAASSNEEWVVPAGPESRRWFVLRASDVKLQDFEYFSKLVEFIDTQMGTVLYYMMNRKITHNLAVAPMTEWLKEQRAETATQDSVAMFWEREAENNYAGLSTEEYNGQVISSCASMFEAYSGWCIDNRVKPRSRAIFYSRMSKYGCTTGPRIHDLRHFALPSAIEVRKSLNIGEQK